MYRNLILVSIALTSCGHSSTQDSLFNSQLKNELLVLENDSLLTELLKCHNENYYHHILPVTSFVIVDSLIYQNSKAKVVVGMATLYNTISYITYGIDGGKTDTIFSNRSVEEFVLPLLQVGLHNVSGSAFFEFANDTIECPFDQVFQVIKPN
ncbi:MAG: hypothetical protein ACI9JN_002733 [Bacteroidia bacterium]|jgi:hypothetical protein